LISWLFAGLELAAPLPPLLRDSGNEFDEGFFKCRDCG